ncbi:MAG: hypothetical protein HOO96_41765 [Polyangiaceae bacterium]|nr:hypothetical protein [Polyangiaceae bacterium]
MRPRLRQALFLASILGCERGSHGRPPPATESGAEGRPARADATRAQVRVTSCLPVGYGMACATEVRTPNAPDPVRASLEACVGSSLYARLEKAPLVGATSSPVSLWMDTTPAPESARYCGVIILPSGAHLQVVDFEGAKAN